MFTSSAIQANKKPLPWILLGFALWIGLNGLFIIITYGYLLLMSSVPNKVSMQKSEVILQGISAAIIIAVGFIVKEKIIKR